MRKKIIVSLAWLLIIILVYPLFFQTLVFSPFPFSVPSVTKTKLGSSADPIDIIILGDKKKITDTFVKAGWIIPEKTDKNSTRRIISASIKNKSYPSAPVSKLYLSKKVEDLAFEFPTKTVRERHHIRLWQTTNTLSNQQVWIGADTYDSRIELSRKDLLPTHHVDANIDKERDFLVTTLTKHYLVANIQTVKLTLPIILGFNGNGDWYYDDGNVFVITLK